jgi:hypothetical protein
MNFSELHAVQSCSGMVFMGVPLVYSWIVASDFCVHRVDKEG